MNTVIQNMTCISVKNVRRGLGDRPALPGKGYDHYFSDNLITKILKISLKWILLMQMTFFLWI